MVFQKLDEAIVEDNSVPQKSTLDEWLGLNSDRLNVKPDTMSGHIILHQRDSDEEMEHPEYGRLTKSFNR
jgi:hypothetical protein